MYRGRFFSIILVWAILGLASASWAQTGYGFDRERDVGYSREGDVSVVRVYGPDKLTELAREAILEKQPGVAVETYYEPLKDKVRIEGTTGTRYMSLSPKRVNIVESARARGKSVYAALCNEQKGVINKTVGTERAWYPVRQEEYRVATRRTYVRQVYLPPPPPAVCVPFVTAGVVVGGHYPVYGYGARVYGGGVHVGWEGGGHYSYKKGWKGHSYSHKGHKGHH